MKLYWRVKLDGKWTWRPANVNTVRCKLCGNGWHIPRSHLDVGPVVEGPEPQPEPLE